MTLGLTMSDRPDAAGDAVLGSVGPKAQPSLADPAAHSETVASSPV